MTATFLTWADGNKIYKIRDTESRVSFRSRKETGVHLYVKFERNRTFSIPYILWALEEDK